ncbi:MAG: alanine racemase [Lachnospiraceae bacterium]|nr:alanine racemase [Agathobacter sp.]MDD6290639.1 alanine racemase [Lachnospiraceae bacterium]
MEKYRVYAGIDLNAVRYNMESMHKNLKEGTRMAAVIKADAYGHGALKIAEAIENLSYLWGYAVATADEAEALIQDGRKKPVLILGISFPTQYEQIVADDIRPAVCEYAVAKELSDIAVRQNRICQIHIKIDTGMSRIGFQVTEESADIIAQIASLPHINIEGIFTHFAQADECDKTSTIQQLAAFQKMIAMLRERGVEIPIHHCSNSAGIVEIPDANLDMVRAGITLYGLWPSEEVSRDIIDLKPVMSIKSHISFVKELEAGRKISYGGTYITPSARRIATIPVGYADGYARGLSNKGYVLIHGEKAPICGRICMDQFMVDITDIPEASEGDSVTLLGRDGNALITMEELGEWSGRFNYEFACLITPRVPRIYFE